jgi:hypothetical protein
MRREEKAMRRLFPISLALSIGILTPIISAYAAAPATPSPYFGRWTVSDDKPHYTAKGREYKTFDIVPCGKDFCGVSVSDSGQCGPNLFRFLTKHAREDRLDGHSKWGAARMNLSIEHFAGDNPPSNQLYLGLGDRRYQMDSRSSSMPKFTASYRRSGNATCTAK